MKKLLVLGAAIVFLAAACNRTPVSQNSNGTSTSRNKVDAAVDALNASVSGEETINLQTDDDIIYSDKSVINSYDGVSNGNF